MVLFFLFTGSFYCVQSVSFCVYVYQPLRFTGFEQRIWICFIDFIWSVLATSGA